MLKSRGNNGWRNKISLDLENTGSILNFLTPLETLWNGRRQNPYKNAADRIHRAFHKTGGFLRQGMSEIARERSKPTG